MSAFEQKVEAPDREWQYLLFAAEPYETIAFKIPNHEVDSDPSRFQTNWDVETKTFTVQFLFKAGAPRRAAGSSGAPPPPPST